jgi:hypothetical protein
MKKTENTILPLALSERSDDSSLADYDVRKQQFLVRFKEPDKDDIRENSLNRYIEAARVRTLSDFQ